MFMCSCSSKRGVRETPMKNPIPHPISQRNPLASTVASFSEDIGPFKTERSVSWPCHDELDEPDATPDCDVPFSRQYLRIILREATVLFVQRRTSCAFCAHFAVQLSLNVTCDMCGMNSVTVCEVTGAPHFSNIEATLPYDPPDTVFATSASHERWEMIKRLPPSHCSRHVCHVACNETHLSVSVLFSVLYQEMGLVFCEHVAFALVTDVLCGIQFLQSYGIYVVVDSRSILLHKETGRAQVQAPKGTFAESGDDMESVAKFLLLLCTSRHFDTIPPKDELRAVASEVGLSVSVISLLGLLTEKGIRASAVLKTDIMQRSFTQRKSACDVLRAIIVEVRKILA